MVDLAQTILYSAANVRGIFAANREDFKTMVSALEVGGVKPVIDKVGQIAFGAKPNANLLDLCICRLEGCIPVYDGRQALW